MKSVAQSFMWWPGLNKEIEHLAKSCQSCQAVKRAPPVTPLHPCVWPSKPWHRFQFGFCWALSGIDVFGRCRCLFEVARRVMSTTTASATVNVLREWFAVHGIPEQIVTDNGTQFTLEIFVKRNGIYQTCEECTLLSYLKWFN